MNSSTAAAVPATAVVGTAVAALKNQKNKLVLPKNFEKPKEKKIRTLIKDLKKINN